MVTLYEQIACLHSLLLAPFFKKNHACSFICIAVVVLCVCLVFFFLHLRHFSFPLGCAQQLRRRGFSSKNNLRLLCLVVFGHGHESSWTINFIFVTLPFYYQHRGGNKREQHPKIKMYTGADAILPSLPHSPPPGSCTWVHICEWGRQH